ncbi:MAG: DUF3365 domain-containing protein [Magnetococcales bacterium]|nr:DUF3365 domain-containing protein [Magnetococcales bacterium]
MQYSQESDKTIKKNILYSAMVLGLLWSVLVIASLVWNVYNKNLETESLAINAANSIYDKDRAFHLWASSHGGVYVPPTTRTPPNPALEHIEDRDVETLSGKKLTLMNPAYMLRQLMDDFPGLYGVRGRITSLDPLNSQNRPDEWEEAALKTLASTSADEVMKFVLQNGEPVLRLMRPMYVEESCLKCHGHQAGYKPGAKYGGVGVSVPMTPYIELQQKYILIIGWSHVFLWLLGVVVIWLYTRLQLQRQLERIEGDKANTLLMEQQQVILSLLKLAINPVPLNQLLESVLKTIFSIPWLAILSKGSIFLVDKKSDELHMVAQHGLATELLSKCKSISFGYCLCGRAATSKEIVFKSSIDNEHEVQFAGIQPHGHYCIPILFEQNLLGVLNLYVPENHSRQREEEEFLQAIVSTIAMIIKHKQEEDLLLRLSSAVEQSPTTVMISDMQGVIEYVNPKFTDVTGYTAQEVIGKKPSILKSGDKSPEDYKMLWQAIMAGKEWRGEFKNRKKSGELFWEFASISPISNKVGENTSIIAIKEDITERKKIERKIRSSLTFQTIISHLLRSGILPLTIEELCDYTLDLVLTVPGFAIEAKGAVFMRDTDLDKMVLKSHRNLSEELIAKLDQQSSETGVCRIAAANQRFFFSEYIEGGESSLLEMAPFGHYCVPIIFNNQILGMITIYVPPGYQREQDEDNFLTTVANTVASIIKRKEAEDELFKHRDHLDKLVKVRTADLEKANQAKSEFLANMSHELRTPLHAVMSFSEMGVRRINKLIDKIATADKSTDLKTLEDSFGLHQTLNKVVHYSSRIESNGKQLRSLIDNLLDLAKLESGKIEFSFQLHELLNIVDIEKDGLETLFQDKDLELDVVPPENKLMVYCDNAKISQVVRNLFSNAIKFTPAGKKITVSFTESNLNGVPMSVLMVRDEGTGIPPQELELVFDKFAQSSRTKTQAGGTGLGLAICLEIVTAHNGTIQAENNPDGGSLFTVMLPQQEPDDE